MESILDLSLVGISLGVAYYVGIALFQIVSVVLAVWYLCVINKALKFANPDDNGIPEIILCFLCPPVAFCLAERKVSEACAQRGMPHEDRKILYLVVGFLGFPIVDCIMLSSAVKKARMSVV